jgi:hypothetical protein
MVSWFLPRAPLSASDSAYSWPQKKRRQADGPLPPLLFTARDYLLTAVFSTTRLLRRCVSF